MFVDIGKLYGVVLLVAHPSSATSNLLFVVGTK